MPGFAALRAEEIKNADRLIALTRPSHPPRSRRASWLTG